MEEDYSTQQLITVFWDFNRKNNNYLDTLYETHINQINNIDINEIDDKEKTGKYLKIINEYETFIMKIRGLRDCLDKLFEGSTIKKIDNYDVDFIKKINSIYVELCTKTEINLSPEKFVNLMYENTPEGRIIQQNKTAISALNNIKNAEDFILKIKTKIKTYTAPVKIVPMDYVEKEINSDDYSSDDNDDNKSTGSLSD